MVRARGTKRDYSENKRNTSYTETEVMQHALAGKKFLRYLELTQGEYWQTAKHHVLLTEKLGEVEKYIATGEGIPRLAIFMPPRVGKSMVCTKTFPSWFLGRNPDRECIVISYGADLAYDFSRANRELFREYAYPIWGKELADDTQGVANWGIKGHRGGLKASGIGGAITGRGADLLLIDDPVKNAIEGASEITQQKNIEWYQSTAYTRLSPKGAVIIIMTRWNSEDLAGKLLHLDEIGQGDHWEVVRLPALCDSQNDPVGRQIGEPLWPERFPLDWWEGRRTVETLYWEALYQQTPLDLTESIFKIEEMVTYDTRHLSLDKCKFFGACDPSAGGDDYSAISTIAVTPELEWVVYDCRLSRETQLDTINAVVAAAKEFRYDGFYIEANSLGHAKAASGSSIFEIELRRQLTEAGIALPYEFVWNSSNKEDRIRSIHPFYVNKTLQFREDWNKKYPKLMKQLQRFPHGAHDDGPDSIELAIRAIVSKSRKPTPVLNIPRVIARARDVTRFGIF